MHKVFGVMRGVVGVLAMLGFAALAIVVFVGPGPTARPSAASQFPAAVPGRAPSPISPLVCLGPARLMLAASHNRTTIDSASVTPFGVAEKGWGVYAPLIAHEIGTPCAPDSAGFAAAFAQWQGGHSLAATGEVDEPALSLLAATWLLRRPFVRAMKTGCPASPPENTLATAAPAESFGGKTIQARPAALEAYRRMVAKARRDLPLTPPLLTIASAYRGPVEEAARCADGACGNPGTARCSAHRTGLALDLYLGAAPGRSPFSTDDDDRLAQARSPAYRWLVQHAEQFGFAPYPYEPWHWEWTGEEI